MTENIIDVSLIPTDLSLWEFICLHQLAHQKPLPEPSPDMQALIAKGYLKQADSGEYLVREQTLKLFKVSDRDLDSCFLELLTTYPQKVGTGTNIRVLHAMDPDALANRKLKAAYGRVLGKDPKKKHAEIITLLNRQLLAQRGNLQYLQQLETWINQRTWEKWVGVTDEDHGSSDATVL